MCAIFFLGPVHASPSPPRTKGQPFARRTRPRKAVPSGLPCNPHRRSRHQPRAEPDQRDNPASPPLLLLPTCPLPTAHFFPPIAMKYAHLQRDVRASALGAPVLRRQAASWATRASIDRAPSPFAPPRVLDSTARCALHIPPASPRRMELDILGLQLAPRQRRLRSPSFTVTPSRAPRCAGGHRRLLRRSSPSSAVDPRRPALHGHRLAQGRENPHARRHPRGRAMAYAAEGLPPQPSTFAMANNVTPGDRGRSARPRPTSSTPPPTAIELIERIGPPGISALHLDVKGHVQRAHARSRRSSKQSKEHLVHFPRQRPPTLLGPGHGRYEVRADHRRPCAQPTTTATLSVEVFDFKARRRTHPPARASVYLKKGGAGTARKTRIEARAVFPSRGLSAIPASAPNRMVESSIPCSRRAPPLRQGIDRVDQPCSGSR